MRDPNYWLKPIHAQPGTPVAEDWVTEHPWLLSVVGSAWPMRDIRAGDFVIYYAAGHQKIVAVARVTQDGGTETTRERADLTGADYALEVQVRVAVPRVAAAPRYTSIPGVTHRKIEGGRPIRLSSLEFLFGTQAIGEASVPSNLRGLSDAIARGPQPVSRETPAPGASWRDSFPGAKVAHQAEGGAIFTAEARGAFWLIVDESAMADLLDEDDADLPLVSIEQYATLEDRDIGLGYRASGRQRSAL